MLTISLFGFNLCNLKQSSLLLHLVQYHLHSSSSSFLSSPSSSLSGLIKRLFNFNSKSNRVYFFSVTPDYVSLGCFDFQYLKEKNILGTNLESKSSAEPFETCSQIAKDRRVQKFGTRKKKGKIRCQLLEKGWYPNAKKLNKCKKKVGSGKSIFIYLKYLDSSVVILCPKRYQSIPEILCSVFEHFPKSVTW